MANDKNYPVKDINFLLKGIDIYLDDIRSKLIKSMEYSKSGKYDEAEAIRQEIIDSLQDKIKRYERDICCTAQQYTNFDRSVLPEKAVS
jgi:hypothetical protein